MTTAVPDPIATAGIDLLRWAQQQSPEDLPTVDRLIGMSLDRVEPGDIAISVTTRPDFSNPLGTVHGGISATLLDSALGCAVHSMLPAGTLYTTLELSINYVRAASVDGSTLTATGKVVHRGSRTATAEGRLHDQHGRLIAHAKTTCLIFAAPFNQPV